MCLPQLLTQPETVWKYLLSLKNSWRRSSNISLPIYFNSSYVSYHDSTYPYNYSKEYWNLVAARLAFVIVFVFIVYSITSMIAWIIPDVPEYLKFKSEREKQVVREKLGKASDDEEESEEEDDLSVKATLASDI